MKNLFLLSLLAFVTIKSFGQAKTDSPKTVHRTFMDSNDLQKQRVADKIVNMYVVDSLRGYKAVIPAWLKLRETGSDWTFGGMLPAVDGIENVIMIKAYPKKAYADMAAFKDFVIGTWAFGTHPKWSDEHACYGIKDMDYVPGIGQAFRASNFWQNHIYTCKYVLAETKTAFLWIDFTATPTTYEVNLPKFDEFLKGLQLL
jgi:hypothetical protein